MKKVMIPVHSLPSNRTQDISPLMRTCTLVDCLDESWKKCGVMGAIQEDTTKESFPALDHYGAEFLTQIRQGQDVEGIRRRIVSLVLSGEILNGDLFVFHENTWATKKDFDQAYHHFQESLLTGELMVENDL